jgi:hypothetical protein
MRGTRGSRDPSGTLSVALELTLFIQQLRPCPLVTDNYTEGANERSAGTDLFTFWPPGPPDRLKEISPM